MTCPTHGIPDCSPLLNGCSWSGPAAAEAVRPAPAVGEPGPTADGAADDVAHEDAPSGTPHEAKGSTLAQEPEPFVGGCTISVEVEAGIDEDWDSCGLDEIPENAEALLALIKAESNDDIGTFISDWDLMGFVSVTIAVRKEIKPGRWEHSSATWSRP